ncbi:MAG: LysR family transcriptional regulator [Rhodocyclaceae bacterium]|nr:LysR family transcriptional regulator [Rhodocyclaceae bacterium]MBP6278928.1 LysR family transcriptional regulator [Rhodocyclaceae bacterium]
MNKQAHRPLAVGALRTFEALARHLNFRAVGEELHVTQSAVSRQIRALEDEIGTPLFVRGTRNVAITEAGTQLLRVVLPLLDRLDATVRQIRYTGGRKSVSVTTFASFASLWLIPRLDEFQKLYPDIDIRISAVDTIAHVDDSSIDLALRHCLPAAAPPGAQRLFGEVLTPMVGASLAAKAASKQGPRLRIPGDLTAHTLLEEINSHKASGEFSWRKWLQWCQQPTLEPKRWVTMNFTHQQIQAALSGQGVALARLALVTDPLTNGELVEPFGAALRLRSPYCYWLVAWPGVEQREEVRAFIAWIMREAKKTRASIGEAEDS